ncbi:MAG TPA: RHS repeat-associated core domain-containing protein, partial [Chthonomonadaceae bacterium]|nr:RHS repeat-associated core domain-containing protein [Chthonomonadaceae bacterium]
SAGNCTSVTVGGNTTSLTWDDSSRCTGITYPSSATNSFSYNGEDLRVSKTDSAGTSAPITDGTSPASAVLKDARAVYTPGISERTTSSPASKYYHTDALGSTRGITDASQSVTDAVLYDAFGMTVSRSGSTATPFGFVGAAQYQTDADSGLMLLGHRMYDASIGRFISSDPAQDGDNWYAYCGGNPLEGTDPEGLADKSQNSRPHKGNDPLMELPDDELDRRIRETPPGKERNKLIRIAKGRGLRNRQRRGGGAQPPANENPGPGAEPQPINNNPVLLLPLIRWIGRIPKLIPKVAPGILPRIGPALRIGLPKIPAVLGPVLIFPGLPLDKDGKYKIPGQPENLT